MDASNPPPPSTPYGRIVDATFRPHPLLRNTHLQTILPAVFRPKPRIDLRRERIELDDGDFVDLGWSGSGNGNGPLVIMLHGLGGGFESTYALGLMQRLNARGWRSVMLQLRGAGPEPNRLARTYHHGDTEDFRYVCRLLRARTTNAAARRRLVAGCQRDAESPGRGRSQLALVRGRHCQPAVRTRTLRGTLAPRLRPRLPTLSAASRQGQRTQQARCGCPARGRRSRCRTRSAGFLPVRRRLHRPGQRLPRCPRLLRACRLRSIPARHPSPGADRACAGRFVTWCRPSCRARRCWHPRSRWSYAATAGMSGFSAPVPTAPARGGWSSASNAISSTCWRWPNAVNRPDGTAATWHRRS